MPRPTCATPAPRAITFHVQFDARDPATVRRYFSAFILALQDQRHIENLRRPPQNPDQGALPL